MANKPHFAGDLVTILSPLLAGLEVVLAAFPLGAARRLGVDSTDTGSLAIGGYHKIGSHFSGAPAVAEVDDALAGCHVPAAQPTAAVGDQVLAVRREGQRAPPEGGAPMPEGHGPQAGHCPGRQWVVEAVAAGRRLLRGALAGGSGRGSFCRWEGCTASAAGFGHQTTPASTPPAVRMRTDQRAIRVRVAMRIAPQARAMIEAGTAAPVIPPSAVVRTAWRSAGVRAARAADGARKPAKSAAPSVAPRRIMRALSSSRASSSRRRSVLRDQPSCFAASSCVRPSR